MTTADLIQSIKADLERLDMQDRAYYLNRKRNAQDRCTYEHRKEERAALMCRLYEAFDSIRELSPDCKHQAHTDEK